MDKKTLLAVTLCMVIFFAWQFFFSPQTKVPLADNTTKQTNQITSANQLDNTSQQQAINNVITEAEPVVNLSEPVKVSSEVLDVFFDPQSGDIRRASILGWTDVEGAPITFNKGGGYNYYKLITPIASGFTQSIEEKDNAKIVNYTSTRGDLTVTKRYIIPNDSYLIKTSVIVSNASQVALSVPLQVKVGPRLGDGFESSQYIFEGAIINSNKSTERIESDKSKTAELNNPLWAGYTSKYFLFAGAGGAFEKGAIAPETGGEVASLMKTIIVNPGDTATEEFSTYIGPKSYNHLKELGLGLQKAIDFGWFYFLAIPMLQIMLFFYGIVHNYGVSIIILTIIVKIVTLPLTLKSMKSMKAMTKLQPEMLALKEKFKGDPQKLNVATMDLYKKNKVNPMSGCLPLVIQIPIFFALYKALLLSIELKGAPFFGWIVDLSAKDPYYITPIIMGISMFVQQKMTPSTADPMQQKIFLAMPIIFTFLFLSFPSGLVIYWLTNNLLSILQQYIVNKRSA